MPDDPVSRPRWPPAPPGTRQPAAARRFGHLWAPLGISLAIGAAAIAVVGAVVLGLRDPPARGDVAALRYPKNPARSFAMRVVGLPGESLSIADGVVSIDGRPIAEPCVSDASRTHETRGIRTPKSLEILLGGVVNSYGDNVLTAGDAPTVITEGQSPVRTTGAPA